MQNAMTRRHFLITTAALTLAQTSIASMLSNIHTTGFADWYFRKIKNGFFVNAHNNLGFRVHTYYRPRKVDRSNIRQNFSVGKNILSEVLSDSIKEKKPIRAHGSKWSMTDILKVEQGFLLDNRGLNYIKLGFDQEFFTDQFLNSYPKLNQRICFVQSGCLVRELNQFLEPRNFALATQGASDGQTVVGAISTGTHGAAIGRGSMHDFVRAIHIMVDNQKSFIIQRSNPPTFNNSLAQSFDAELISDDDLFLSALVSFGSFGLIHGVFIQVDPLYKLEGNLQRFNYDQIRPGLSSLQLGYLGYSESPYHYEVIVNPYGMKKGHKGAFVQTMFLRPSNTPSNSLRPPQALQPCMHLLKFVSGLTSVFPALIPGQVRRQMGSNLYRTRPHNEVWTPGNLFKGGPVYMTISCELGVHPKDVPMVMEIGSKITQTSPFPGVFSARYVKSSDAYLAFTCLGEVTCAIEFAGLLNRRSYWFFKRLYRELDAQGIHFTWHWGKLNDYNAKNVREKFGADQIDKWIQTRRNFLNPVQRERFSNQLLKHCQLN